MHKELLNTSSYEIQIFFKETNFVGEMTKSVVYDDNSAFIIQIKVNAS